jgi:integrase
VIIALTVAEYELLLTQAHAEVAGDPLLGWRDVAIIRTLGECGLRAEELCQLQRRDYRPTRKGARKRELHIRHGKGSRTRSVPASANVRRAVVRWDQLRRRQAPGTQGQPVENDPLFVTIGVRRRDGGYSALGRQVTYDTNAEVIKRLGERAELPAEKRGVPGRRGRPRLSAGHDRASRGGDRRRAPRAGPGQPVRLGRGRAGPLGDPPPARHRP